MKIYVIIDVNGLKYVGKTSQSLKTRLSGHKADAKRTRSCSSNQLDLYNCEIILIQECSDEDSRERENFWINGLTCVNKNKGDFNVKEWRKGEKRKQYEKQWGIVNREKTKQYNKEYYLKNKSKH